MSKEASMYAMTSCAFGARPRGAPDNFIGDAFGRAFPPPETLFAMPPAMRMEAFALAVESGVREPGGALPPRRPRRGDNPMPAAGETAADIVARKSDSGPADGPRARLADELRIHLPQWCDFAPHYRIDGPALRARARRAGLRFDDRTFGMAMRALGHLSFNRPVRNGGGGRFYCGLMFK